MRLNNIWISSIVILIFVFSGCGGGGGGSSEVVSTTTNTAPVAKAIELTTNEEITISANFDVTDAEDKYFQYEITQQPLHGTLVVENEYNIFTYSPETGFTGSDSFRYKAYDGKSYSNEVSVTIEVKELTFVSQSDVDAPSKPVIISLNSPSSNTITLYWSASSDSDTASDDMIYEVHMSSDENFTITQSTKKLSIKGAQEATVTDLDPLVVYYVKIKAIDLGGNSALSNEMSIQTSEQSSVVLNSANTVQTASSLFLNNTIVEDSNITYTLDEKALAPQEGDILVGTIENRYLRKVTSVVTNNDEVILETQQVAMSEVFDDLVLQTKTMLYDPSQLTATSQAISRYKSYSYNAPTVEGYSWQSGKFAIEKNIPDTSKFSTIKKAPINLEDSYVIISSASEDEITVVSGETLHIKILAELNNLSSSSFDSADINRTLQSFELVSVEHDGETSSDNFGFVMNVSSLSVEKKEAEITFIATDAKASIKPYILKLRATANWYDTTLFTSFEDDTTEIEISVYVLTKDVEANESFKVSVEDDGKYTTYTLPIVGTLPKIPNEEEGSYRLKASVGVDVDFTPVVETEISLKKKLAYIKTGGKMTLELESLFEASSALSNSYDIDLTAINKKFINVYLAGVVPVYQEIDITWKLILTPTIAGDINVTNKFTQTFDVNFGVNCNADECIPINDNESSSVYVATIDLGAEASLEVRLVPEIKITFYEAAAAGITVEPWVNGALVVSGSLEFNNDLTSYDTLGTYSLDELNATIGVESKVFVDLTTFDINWFHYPKDEEYKTIYSSEPKTVFSVPSIAIMQPDSTEFIKNKNIAINAWVENGIGSYIVDDTVEWFVYPS